MNIYQEKFLHKHTHSYLFKVSLSIKGETPLEVLDFSFLVSSDFQDISDFLDISLIHYLLPTPPFVIQSFSFSSPVNITEDLSEYLILLQQEDTVLHKYWSEEQFKLISNKLFDLEDVLFNNVETIVSLPF